MIKKIQSLLGTEFNDLLNHNCQGFPKEGLHLPGVDFIDQVWATSDQSAGDLRSLASLFEKGRLEGAVYGSILPQEVGVKRADATCQNLQNMNFDRGTTIALAVAGVLDFGPTTKNFVEAGWDYMSKVAFDSGMSQNKFIWQSFVHKHGIFADIEHAFIDMQASQSNLMLNLEATKNKLNEYHAETQTDMEKLRSEINDFKEYMAKRLLKDELKRIKWIFGIVIAVITILISLMAIK